MSQNLDGLPDWIRSELHAWAEQSTGVRRVYVFGSRAKGTSRPCSDIDIALVLDEVHGNQLSKLVVNQKAWQAKLTQILGITVRDLYLADDPASAAYGPVRDHGILIFDRAAS